jgi:hypothetical protein
MPTFPILCAFCGLTESPSNLVDTDREVTFPFSMQGNRAPCSRCGRMADIIDGEYYLVNGVVNGVSNLTVDQLLHLKSILDIGSESDLSPEEIVGQITQAAPPALANILQQWLDSPGAGNRLTLIGILLTIITMALSRYPPAPALPSSAVIQNIVCSQRTVVEEKPSKRQKRRVRGSRQR